MTDRAGALEIGSGPGRGAWLCAGRRECLDRAARSGGLARALRVEVCPAALDALRDRLFPRDI